MSKRYCVTCGQLLTRELARGLVCTECFGIDKPGTRFNRSKQLIQPRFCWRCGAAFQPASTKAIKHAPCPV